MTLAVGVSPGDGSGAILVTDSLVQHRRPDGVRALLCLTPRFEALPGAWGAAVVSAMTRGGWAPSSSAEGIEAAAAELIADLSANLSETPWQFVGGRQAAPRGEIVAAGLALHGAVRLARWRTGDVPEWATGPTVFVGGAAAELDVVPGAVPGALSACVDYALGLTRELLAEDRRRNGYGSLEAALSLGQVPSMAPPYWLAVVTAQGIDIRRES